MFTMPDTVFVLNHDLVRVSALCASIFITVSTSFFAWHAVSVSIKHESIITLSTFVSCGTSVAMFIDFFTNRNTVSLEVKFKLRSLTRSASSSITSLT